MLQGVLNKNVEKHQKTEACKKGQRRRKNEKLQDIQHEAGKKEFFVYGKKLEQVSEFKYLGRILTDNDDDTKAIEGQLKKARQQWNSISRILKREQANAMCMAKFYMAVVQAVLLYGADSWVITDKNWTKLRTFHNRALRYMTGKHITKNEDGTWEYPCHTDLQWKCGLFNIETYVERRRGTLRKYLTDNRGELLEEAMQTRKPARNANKILWWEQKFITKEEMTTKTNFWKKKRRGTTTINSYI